MVVEQFLYLFSANTDSLEDGEKQAQKENEKLQKGLKETDKIANDMGEGFSDLIATAGGALVSLLSFSALSAGIAETSQYIDNLGKTSRLYGENANQLAAYQELIVKSGGDIGSFQGVIKKLNGDFNEFVTTGNTGILPFMQRLGIDMVDSSGKARKVLDVLPELADQFSTMSKAESAGLGEKLGLDEATITLLQQGRAEVEKQVKAQEQLFSVTDEQIKVFEDFNDSVSDTSTAFRGMFVQIGADILPILQYFLERVQGIVGFFAKHKDFATGLFIALGTAITAYALPAIIKLGTAMIVNFAPFYLIGGIIAGIAISAGLLYDDFMTFLEGGNSGLEKLLKWLNFTDEEIEGIRKAFKELGTTIVKAFSFAFDLFKGFMGLVGTVAKGLYKAFEPLLWLFGKAIVGSIQLAINSIKKIADIAGSVMDFFGFGEDDKNIKVDKELNLNTSSPQKLTKEQQEQRDYEAAVMGAYARNFDQDEVLQESANNPLNNTNSNIISNNSNRSSNSNVNIDKIEVQTQATDTDTITREIGNSLNSELKRTTATFEDGIQG